jgi:outer membrane receptor protein involved in Fe transport
MTTFARSIRLQCACTLLALICLFSVVAVAQEATGRIIGVVTDPSGSVIPRAKVTVTNVATGESRDATVNDDGSYQVLSLPPGTYKVTAEAQGFRKSVTGEQILDIDRALKVDVKMEVGSTTETVQVEATASGVETVTAMLGQVVTGNQIHNAPLNGRNVMDLATLMPGVIPAVAGPTTTAGGTGFSIAGARTDSITFMLDGGLNSNLLNNGLVLNPNPDAIEEFRVLTSNYSAEYGRNAGGIVSVITRSGSNEYHGALYDYVRNSYFNANSFFNNEQGLPIDSLKRNQFGVVISGPIAIPKIVNGRNRMFFMMAYQGQRQSQLQTSSKVNVFTPAELNGDFSHSNASGTGPDLKVASYLASHPFFQPNAALAAQGIIDPSKINSIATNYIKAGLIATSPTGFTFAQGAARDDRDELTEKLDFVITQNDHLSFTLGSNRNPVISPFAFSNVNGFANATFANRYLGSVNYTKTFSPRLINEFRFTAQRNHVLQAVPVGNAPKPSALGVGITSDDPTGPPILGFTSLTAGFSPQGPTALIDNTYNWSDTITWIKGRHGIKAGLNYTPYQNNTAYDFYVNGEFFFYGTGGGSFSQNDRADFLLGLPDEYLQFPRAPSNIRSHNIGFFVQDEWKVRRNLTLTLGVRYEYSSPKLDTQGRSYSAILGRQSTVFPNAPLGLVFPGDPNTPVGSNFPDRRDWAPRLGFAWDPKGDGKMSVRGGIGKFYDILKGEDNLQFNGQAPFFGTADLFFDPLNSNPTQASNYLSNPFVAAGQPNPFPSQPPAKNVNFAAAGFTPGFGAGGVYFVDPNLKTPYAYQYNLAIQRELFRNTTLEVAYIGSTSHRLTALTEGDPFVLGTKTRLFNAQPGVAPGTFSYLDTFRNVGNAHYNSLATGLTKRYTDTRYLGSLAFQLSYTYGHSIDNVSGFRSRDSRVPYYNFNQFVGSSDFDLRHFIAFSGSWELPFAKAWASGPRRFTKGWTLNPIITYRSGAPLDVLAGLNRSSTRPGPSGAGDSNLVRANLVGGQINFLNPENFVTSSTGPLSGNGKTGNYFFDPSNFDRTSLVALYNSSAAVADPTLRTFGNLGRNAFVGPDRTNVNLSFGKITNLYGDRVLLEIHADFFNALNHTQFNNPNVSITSSTFGQISGTADPRIIQLAARFTF